MLSEPVNKKNLPFHISTADADLQSKKFTFYLVV
jgi:hypothetical protein